MTIWTIKQYISISESNSEWMNQIIFFIYVLDNTHLQRYQDKTN